MQLNSSKTSFVDQQHYDKDYQQIVKTSLPTKTPVSATPGNSVETMSLTNIVLNSKSALDRLRDPTRSNSFTNAAAKEASSIDNRLLFNVCGEKFDVLESTVERYPNTLLGDRTKRGKFWDANRQEFYLDRNRACFESVLTYYQSNGILIRPQNIPDVLFIRELQFYDLGDEVLQIVKGMRMKFHV